MTVLTTITHFLQVALCKPLTKTQEMLVSRRAVNSFAAAAANTRGARRE